MSSEPKFVDYYAILGASMDTSWADLKTAYLREALVLHPDKNPDPEATSMFQMVSNLALNLIFLNHSPANHDLLS
jgi:curved DNA-binding protein CbpA